MPLSVFQRVHSLLAWVVPVGIEPLTLAVVKDNTILGDQTIVTVSPGFTERTVTNSVCQSRFGVTKINPCKLVFLPQT